MEEIINESTVSNFKSSTYLYSTLIDKVTLAANSPAKMKQLELAIKDINNKNSFILQTAIVGNALLINENDQSKIFDCLGFTKNDVIEVCKKSSRLNGAGKIMDQFAFALPLLLLSGVLYNQKKKVLSEGIFLFTYYRPYASKVAAFFTLGIVDEKAMEYTINFELTDKSYIHKYGTIYNVLVESSKTAYNTYIEELAAVNHKPTDDMIFNNIFYSAIFSKTGSWIKSLYGVYKSVKASGKALQYEKTFFGSINDDSGNMEYAANEVSSDSSIKKAIVSKAITKFNIAPIDSLILTISAKYGFAGAKSSLYESYLEQALRSISESKSEIIPKYFDAIVGSFLDTDDINGIKNKASEVSTIKFLAYSKKNFKTSNTINSNIREVQNTTEELLLTCSEKYVNSGVTQKRQLKLALFMYFVIFIQKA